MKTLVDIINFIENLRSDYKTELDQCLWHATISIGYCNETTCFFFDNREETIEIRANVIAVLGKPHEKISFEQNEKTEAYTVYKYKADYI